MSSAETLNESLKPTSFIFQKDVSESSDDSAESIIKDPMGVVLNEKRKLFAEGLYDPGQGEICTDYIAISDSQVYEHVLFPYHSVSDPGIKNALLHEKDVFVYPDDGQELYLDTCKEMRLRPSRTFYRGLLQSHMDLSYDGITSAAMRAMSISLKNNRFVKTLTLTENFLTNDACFHLREALILNITLVELNLSGCRIGASGFDNLMMGLRTNSSLKVLNLNRNLLKNEGGQLIAIANRTGMQIDDLYLSSNEMTTKTVQALQESFVYQKFNTLRKIDMSWNVLQDNPATVRLFLRTLADNYRLEEVNLAWTSLSGITVGFGIRSLLISTSLKHLDLSHNRLSDKAIVFEKNLERAINLVTLDLSFNPLSQDDALKLLTPMLEKSVHLQRLLMENVDVSPEFQDTLTMVKKHKPNAVVIFREVVKKFIPVGTDIRDIIIDRIDNVLMAKPEHTIDIVKLMLQMKGDGLLGVPSIGLFKAVRKRGGTLDKELTSGLAQVFPGDPNPKLEMISIDLFLDYIRRKCPDRLLPTPVEELPK